MNTAIQAGDQFGRLTVAARAGKDNGGHDLWLCLCECGNRKIIAGYNLTSGAIKSCGCLRKEVAGQLNKTHGGSGSRLYSIWCNMKTRTGNPRGTAYDAYGGRGITVCSEWRNRFDAFQHWALENGYRDDLSIDRINNDGGYSPENCRWATKVTQFNNRRSNRRITFNGENRTVAQWARFCSIDRHTLNTRLNSGWPVERALSIPTYGGKDSGESSVR